jgi:hypothetical protein
VNCARVHKNVGQHCSIRIIPGYSGLCFLTLEQVFILYEQLSLPFLDVRQFLVSEHIMAYDEISTTLERREFFKRIKELFLSKGQSSGIVGTRDVNEHLTYLHFL